MSEDEFHAAMRATARGHQTHRAKAIKIIYDDDDHSEVRRIFNEDWKAYIRAGQFIL